MYQKALAVAVTLGLFGGIAPISANTGGFELSIAHINDTHSTFDEIPSSFSSNTIRSGDPIFTYFGGHPRLLSAANGYRAMAEEQNRSMLSCTVVMPGRAAPTSN